MKAPSFCSRRSQTTVRPRRAPQKSRRAGVTVVLVALMLTSLIGIIALAVDMGVYYLRKNEMQKAADAAALAGAYQLAHFQPRSYADQIAAYYAALPTNGKFQSGTQQVAPPGQFATGPRDLKFSTVYPATNNSVTPPKVENNWYEVKISRPEPTIFAGFLGFQFMHIEASATALFTTNVKLDIKGLGTYGVAPGPVNLSVFGPNGKYSFGDCYSTQFLDDGDPNPLYSGNGYDFFIEAPKTYDPNNRDFVVEVFDPDCWNSDSNINAGDDKRVDEFRTSTGNSGAPNATDATVTKYTLYYDNNTPNDPSDDIKLDQKSVGFDSSTDMKWDQMFNVRQYPQFPGDLRLNVTSTSGSSENGFDLRAGPKRAANEEWDPTKGLKITGDGHLPINFNQSGNVNIALGTIPVEAAGGNLTIRKFDTDVGAQSITYTCDSLPGKSWSGVLSLNGQFASDTFEIPAEYTTPGVWRASYRAGNQDTSVWDMSYDKSGPGSPGSIKLIR